MTWALVPPMPNALTPARIGPPVVGQGREPLLTWNGVLEKSISGFGFL